MRSILLLSALATAIVASPSREPGRVRFINDVLQGKLPEPLVPATAPNASSTTGVLDLSPVHVEGALRQKKRYGPFILPSTKKVNFFSLFAKDNGMLDSIKFTDGPCSDCTVLYSNISLEYKDGSEANANTGAWIHHSIMMATGPGKSFYGCGRGSQPGAEPIIAGGNERTPVSFASPEGEQKSGYYIAPGDKMMYYNELMNFNEQPQEVYVTVTVEYLPGKQPAYRQMQVVWLDLNWCSPFGSKQPKGQQKFTMKGQTWVAPFNGRVINLYGHLHTGGTNVKVYQNDKLLCDVAATYGARPQYVEKSTGKQGKNGMAHISDMSSCTAPGRFQKGDVFYLTADYDFVKHPGMMTNDGKVDEIMGLSALYILPDQA